MMKPGNPIWIVLLLLGSLNAGIAQTPGDTLFRLPDTARVLTIENFYELVTRYHPVAQQANLLTDVARQEIRLARGNFDPKAEISYLTKNFSGQEYYSVFNGSVTFNSVFPVDPKIGIEKNTGDYLNPERYISDQFNYRQLYAGISLPLGRGLITDDRRAALKQAELFRSLTEAEQVRLINNLMLDAAYEYWSWFFSYYNFRLMNRGVFVAQEIFRRTKLNVELGENAPVDSIQAKITLQNRLIQTQEALLAFKNAGIRLSTFLWDSTGQPVSLDLRWVPVPENTALQLSAMELDELTEQARVNHPDLRKLSITLLQLDVSRRLAAEYLKPRLDLNYYLLNQPFTPELNWNSPTGDDYKFGLDFSMPLFLRKERAKLSQVKLKINTTQYERNLAEREVINTIQTTNNALVATAAIIRNQQNMVENYERLLQAELLNFENGESDLFKINIQLEYLLQAQTKWAKLLAEYEKQKASLYWAAGVRKLGRPGL
ncbi:MAG: TolC family protein [Cyclobacteriaceae bacterium]